MHFCVGVIHRDGTDIDDIMRPYDESLEIQKIVEEDGYEYWTNPNAKWDWFEVGGRWSGRLRLKNGERADSALLCDIDTGFSIAAYNNALTYWNDVMQNKAFESPEFMLSHYLTNDIYAALRGMFYFNYVVDADGKWHENDFFFTNIIQEISWAQDFHKNFLYSLNPKEYRITVVDIHI